MLGQVMRTRLGEHPPSRPASGLTFVELMITLTILGVLVAIAVPSMREFMAKQRIRAISKEVATDLKYLRTQATQRRRAVEISFGSNAGATCYVLYGYNSNAFCDCARTDGLRPCGDPAAADANIEYKTVTIPRSTGIELSAVPTWLDLQGFDGMPVGANKTIQISVKGTRGGGEVRVYTTLDLVVPLMCSVSGHESSMPSCPP